MNIGKSNFIKGVLEMLKGKYINRNDLGLLLSQMLNTHKLPFENGLYDLDKKAFRNIEYNDFIINTTGYDYLSEDKTKSKEYKNAYIKIQNIMKDIADDDKPNDNKYISDLQYLKNICSSLLYGRNKGREFYIFTGSGSNSKSWFIESLIKPALGNIFYKSITSDYFTKGSGRSGQATPEMAVQNYTRALISSEPEGNDLLQVGKIKSITGLEDINARQLFGRTFTFVPQFTPIILCNDIPKFNKIDKAIVNRLRIVKFTRKFVHEPTLSYHRKIDEDLSTELILDDIYKQAFINMLIDNYKTMDKRRSKTSIEESNIFVDENNPIKDFIDECLEVSETKTLNKTIYTEYMEWWNKNNNDVSIYDNSNKMVSKRNFIALMKYNEYETSLDHRRTVYWNRVKIVGTRTVDDEEQIEEIDM